MTDQLIAAISQSKDLRWLKECGELNRANGKLDVVAAVDRRIRDLNLQGALRLKPDAQTVESRVQESVRVYRELLKHKHGRNQAAGYTEREIRQYGHREALIRTIRRGKKTDGLKMLAAHQRLDCAYEKIAIDHASEMPDDVVERARRLLAEVQAER